MEGFYMKQGEARKLLTRKKRRIFVTRTSSVRRKGKARVFIIQIAFSFYGG